MPTLARLGSSPNVAISGDRHFLERPVFIEIDPARSDAVKQLPITLSRCGLQSPASMRRTHKCFGPGYQPGISLLYDVVDTPLQGYLCSLLHGLSRRPLSARGHQSGDCPTRRHDVTSSPNAKRWQASPGCAKRTRVTCTASAPNKNGGVYRDRTDDILLAKQALSQLS